MLSILFLFIMSLAAFAAADGNDVTVVKRTQVAAMHGPRAAYYDARLARRSSSPSTSYPSSSPSTSYPSSSPSTSYPSSSPPTSYPPSSQSTPHPSSSLRSKPYSSHHHYASYHSYHSHSSNMPRPSSKRGVAALRQFVRRENPSPRPSHSMSPKPSPLHTSRPSYPSPSPNTVRRSVNEQTALVDLNVILCPLNMFACPVEPISALPTTLEDWRKVDHECVEFDTDLQSCGGCSSIDIGHDCTAIKGAANVACLSGHCQVQTCERGFRVSSDGKSCVAN